MDGTHPTLAGEKLRRSRVDALRWFGTHPVTKEHQLRMMTTTITITVRQNTPKPVARSLPIAIDDPVTACQKLLELSVISFPFER